ncbi:MAG TPA: Uma2 family endonuclease [Gemmataceae bacterium]|nr:Uma2 family endonuclease [Gemmataceae bacterium]
MPDKYAATKNGNRRLASWLPNESRPTWEVAFLFPPQGNWTEQDFLNLDTVHEAYPLIELSHGRLEVLPMPTETHQLIMLFMVRLLEAFTASHAPGIVLCAGMRIRLKNGRFRAPDVLYMKAFWDGADLVMEVVGPDPKDHRRDWQTKAREYARARIPEYWIIDLQERKVRVLVLKGTSYQVHGDFGPRTQVTSVVLQGLGVAVDELLAPPGSQQVNRS